MGKFIAPECERYIGIDVVPSLIERNRSTFVANIEFKCLDIIKDKLPDADLCLIRQVMQHLSNREIVRLLKNTKRYRYVIVAEHQPEVDGIPNINPTRRSHQNFFIRMGRLFGPAALFSSDKAAGRDRI